LPWRVTHRKITSTIQTARLNRANKKLARLRATEEPKMICPSRLLNSFIQDELGQDLIEYALIAALIAVAAIAALKGLTNKISNEFNAIGSSL
jgi:pilus assembly protein Flp/PilA